MIGTYGLLLLVAALAGAGLGVLGNRVWCARAALNQRRIPTQWQLRTRPLLSGVERSVWHWLEGVFFDHHVLVKIPVLRFLSPRSATQGQHSHELLKGLYCSFTVCGSDGRVVGCVDVPGSKGLRASHRDLKKKLFEECGVAYAVLHAEQLPSLETLRAAFLGHSALAHSPGQEAVTTSQMPFSQSVNPVAIPAFAPVGIASQAALSAAGAMPGASQPNPLANGLVSSQRVDMTAIVAARSSLQSKLDKNRKVRLTKIEELSASFGIVDDKNDQKFAAQWDDSFIMGEDSRAPASQKARS